MKKRIISVLVLMLLLLPLSACGDSKKSTRIANPWKEISEEEASALVPNLFKAPDEATNIRWSSVQVQVTEESQFLGPLVQLSFELDGLNYTAREQFVSDASVDVSGMYYQWTEADEVTLANWGGGAMPAKTYRYKGENEAAALCTWYDEETGALYSLSVSSHDLDGVDIQAVAEAIYDPSKQDGAGSK